MTNTILIYILFFIEISYFSFVNLIDFVVIIIIIIIIIIIMFQYSFHDFYLSFVKEIRLLLWE
jgi:hypothetical protein